MPENEEILGYIKRAFELKSQECYKQSIEMLYKALAIEPDNCEILYQLGELYYLLHNYPRALQYTEQILATNDKHLQALDLLKRIYIRQNELIQAKEVAEKIYDLSTNDENLLAIISLCGKLNLLEELPKYQASIETNDKSLYECALAYYRNNMPDKAKEMIEKSLSLNPDNEDCKVLLGKIFFDANELKKSKEIFDTFGKTTQNPEVLNYQGLFALEDLNFVDAIKNFSKASNIDSKNPIYLYNLANAYFLNGWKEEAETAYKKAICIAPNNLDYRYSLAYLYYKYKDFDKAKKEIDFILETDNKHYSARVLKALLQYENKNYLEAERLLLSNIQDGHSDNFTLSSLAKIELELNKYEQAEKYAKSILEKDTQNLTYKCDLGDIYIREKKYNQALDLAKEILSENENFLYGYILGAKAAYLNKDYDECKGYAQEAIGLDINCAEGYYYLALVRVEEQDFEEAIECMKRAITFDVTNAKYYAKMAEIYKQAGDTKTAFEYIKEAESIDDNEEYKILYREYATLNRK